MNKQKYYFLDANALYEYIGRNKLFKGDNRVIKSNYIRNLDEKKFKFLPSSVLTEILVYFRDDIKKINLILNFIEKKTF